MAGSIAFWGCVQGPRGVIQDSNKRQLEEGL